MKMIQNLLIFLICFFSLFSFLRVLQNEDSTKNRFYNNDEHFSFIGTSILDTYEMRYLMDGLRIDPMKRSGWQYAYLSHEPMEEDEAIARLTAVHAILYEKIMEHEHLQKALVSNAFYNKGPDYRNTPQDQIPYQDLVDCKISFWTRDYDRIKPPHVAEVVITQGQLFVFYANPQDDSLQDHNSAT